MKTLSTMVMVTYINGVFDTGYVSANLRNWDANANFEIQSKVIRDYAEAMKALRQAEKALGKSAEMKHSCMHSKACGDVWFTRKTIHIMQCL